MTLRVPNYVRAFEKALRTAHPVAIKIPDTPLLGLPGIRESTRVEHNKQKFQILGRHHEYSFRLPGGSLLEVSVQLYVEGGSYWRLFAYSVVDGSRNHGMLFSVNLTLGRADSSTIDISQKLKLATRASTVAERSESVEALAAHLRRVGLQVTESRDLVFSPFDPRSGRFVSSTAADFIRDFVVAAVIKGHYMKNKGYELPGLAEAPRDDAKFASSSLTPGQAYSRQELRSLFGIRAAAINNGTFHAKPFSSVWLFITENKTADRTQYEDLLDGDELRMEGQTEGKTDRLLREHVALGLELLLFYRKSKRERLHGAFVYEGPFRYVSHEGSRPTRFVLRREGVQTATLVDPPFDPHHHEDARERAMAEVVLRRRQAAFRESLIQAYQGRCAVTGCAVQEVLDAAHILPHRGEHSDHVQNGLLLRADIHKLFDCGHLQIDPGTMTVVLAEELKASPYQELENRRILLPKDKGLWPNVDALVKRRQRPGVGAS